MSNVVIMVWIKHLEMGIGDLLRGTMFLHKLSKIMKFELIVDNQLHSVSRFLISRSHKYSEYVIQNQSKISHAINVDYQTIVNLIQTNQSTCAPILITTNYLDSYYAAPSDECKRFMRSLLIPIDEYKTYFNDKCNELHIPKKYSIIHFRLGDDQLINHHKNPDTYSSLFKIVDYNIKTTPNLYIITDSAQFKQYLKRVLPSNLTNRIIPTIPIHLSHHDTDSQSESVKETLFDFMLLSDARVIKTHSMYGWISGFVHWMSVIFNVPLINLKPQNQFIKTNSTYQQAVIQHPEEQRPVQSVQQRPMRSAQPVQPMRSVQPMSSLMTQIRSNFSPNSHSMKLKF